MLSLIKIRVKYIIRNPCLLFWTYLFLPIIITIVAIVTISKKKKLDMKTFESVILPGDPKKFFEQKKEDEYQNIKPYLPFTCFLVDDAKYCDTIKPLLNEYDITEVDSLSPLCTDKESNFNNYTLNIINIKKKKGKYTVDLTSRNTEMSYFGFGLFFFQKDDLSQDVMTDPYYIEKINDTEFDTLHPQINIYFELQSLVARILIALEGKENLKHNFEMEFGFNKYPDSYQFTNVDEITFPSSLVSFILALQFSLISYNINMRMIDEKEAKLNILLERQGISKFKYMLSWFFTFIALFLFSIIAFIFYIQYVFYFPLVSKQQKQVLLLLNFIISVRYF